MNPAAPRRGRRLALATLALLAVGVLGSCGRGQSEALTVRVLAEHPHATDAFTEGLLLDDGKLYESTGLVGRSSLREVDPASGEVLRRRDIPAPFFGEGLTLVGQRLIQLTWQAGTAFVWDRATFNPLGTFAYTGEGWGLCYDGSSLFMSDGSAVVTRRDPDDFHVLGTLQVTDSGRPVDRINELECVGDSLYANVWLTDRIVRIDKGSGRVTATIDASPLRALMPDLSNPDAVLNGIAYDGDSRRFLLTGKLWPKLFEVEFVPAAGP